MTHDHDPVPSVVAEPTPGDGGVPLALSPELIVFYAIDRGERHLASTVVLRAFLDAFTADDPVALVVKTTAPGADADAGSVVATMLEFARVIRASSTVPRVRIETEEWTPERFAGLHSRGDCLVALEPDERGELDAAEATAHGNPVVTNADRAVERLREVAADLGAARRRASATSTADAPSSRRRDPAKLLLVGLATGEWRSAFENWLEMAERFHYRYELVGRDSAEPYVAHETKWRRLRDYFATLPRRQLVFYLDAADAFVCDGPEATLARYRSYDVPLVVGAESSEEHDGARAWQHANTGAYVGEAGVVADALRDGYALEDWKRYGLVCDQRAMSLYLAQPEYRHRATLDQSRAIVQNIAASARYEEYDQHRELLNRRPRVPFTSSVHFFGDNGRGYNLFARLYGLTPLALQPSGRFGALSAA